MTETSQGVGRVVVLVLFTVLFVAAWRSDHAGTDPSDMRLARATAPRRTISTMVVSAESIGDVLPYHTAARLAPADQTNGLTLHTDRGVSAALTRAIPAPAAVDSTPVVENAIGITLGAQLLVLRNGADERPRRFMGSAAILSGSWLESSGLSVPGAPGVGTGGPGAIDEADVGGLDLTARILR